MKTFPEFWTDITANPHWVEWMERMARMEQKNLKRAAETAYGNLIADPQAFEKYSAEESRKYVGNILKNQKPELVKPQLQQVEEKKEPEPEIEISKEEWDRRMNEWRKMVLDSPLLKRAPQMSRKYFEENGQWEPKKEPVHMNGIDLAHFRLNEAIKKYGRRKYMSLYSFSEFQTFKFGLVDVFAANEEDAKEILKLAERFVKLNY
jgi:hypothetical protein